jgi:hypothetical protein
VKDLTKNKIQQIFDFSFKEYANRYQPSEVQYYAAKSIMACKTGALGVNTRICIECHHTEIHNNSCRNRNCPCCQAVQKERWIDARRSEVIDTPYYHVVFTLPEQLRPLVYINQRQLYSLLHKCASETLLELCADKKYLGATPGIIQVIHSWTKELKYHPHVHIIISGGGLTKAGQLAKRSGDFFIPAPVLASKFRGKFLHFLEKLYFSEKLTFSDSCKEIRNIYNWSEFTYSLGQMSWNVNIKETFNGFGNAIEYLGRYTHRIAISNGRIISVTEAETTFKAFNSRTKQEDVVTISNVEFIRRFLQHVLPYRFQKIRYYGFLNNRSKKKNLQLLFKLIGKQRFRSLYSNMKIEEFLLKVWNIDISFCTDCGCIGSMRPGIGFYKSLN